MCFLCDMCRKPLRSDGKFTFYKDQVLCNDCYITNFQKTCEGCRYAIESGSARLGIQTEHTGTRNVSSAPSVKKPSEPVVLCQKMTSFTAPTAIRICTPSAAPSAANRCPKVASCTTNKRGTKSVLAVIVATSHWRSRPFFRSQWSTLLY